MLRDVVALGLDDERLGQHIVLVVSPKNVATFEETVLRKALRLRLPTYMLPHSVIVRDAIPRSPNGKFDRAVYPVGRDVVTGATRVDPFGTLDGQLAVGGMPLERLATRVGMTPFFAYDRAQLTARVELLRGCLPSKIRLGYAVKANPMPAVVQHLAGLVDALDVASSHEMQIALDTPMPASRVSFVPASSGSTASTAATSRRRSAASSNPASAATSRSTRSTSTPT